MVHHRFDDNNGTGGVIRYLFGDCIWCAPSHFILGVLEIPDIKLLLPGRGGSGELFSFQEDIRSFIFAPDLGIAVVIVFLLLRLVLTNEGLGAVEGMFLLEVDESGQRDISTAHNQRGVLEGSGTLGVMHPMHLILQYIYLKP